MPGVMSTGDVSAEQRDREAAADRAAQAEQDAADPNRKADTTQEAAQEPPD
jgi:hypothetical protein